MQGIWKLAKFGIARRLLGQAMAMVVVAFLVFAFGGASYAAAFIEVSPLRVILKKDRPVAAVEVRNQGDEEVVVQLRLSDWAQEQGADLYVDAEGAMVSPAIVSIPAGGTQIVRVALLDQDRNWETESAMRLFLQEVPPAPEAETPEVQLVVRVSIPVFVQSTVEERPALGWKLEDRGEDGVWITVENTGHQHALISGVRLTQASSILYQAPTRRYILPGNSQSWRLEEAPSPSAVMDLVLATDQGVYGGPVQAGP